MFLVKPWKIKSEADPGWKSLGDSSDSRRQRADNIEREIRQFWLTIITTSLIIAVTIWLGFR